MARRNGVKNTVAVEDKPVEETAPDRIEPAQNQPPPEPEIVDLVKMTPGAMLAEAGRGIIKQQLAKLRKAEPVAREGRDPEGVHDMRVATRRLRAALKVLEETVYEPRTTARFRRQLRGLANALGETRDNDVFLEHLDQYAGHLSEIERTGLEPLRHEIQKRREHGHQAMLKTLDSPKTARLLEKLEKFASIPGKGVAAQPDDTDEVAPTLVRHFAGSAIWRRYEEVLAYETVVGQQTPIATLHRLRVACKRLRYTIEFFQEALSPELKALHKQLVDLQDDLGMLHDHQVAIDAANQLLLHRADDEALQIYQINRRSEMERVREAYRAKWQELSGQQFRQKLGGVLGRVGA